MEIADSLLLIDGDTVASWSDKYTPQCIVTLKHNDREVKSGDTLSEPGVLTVTVTNNQGNPATAEITLVCDTIYGLENLTFLQVDQEINLLN